MRIKNKIYNLDNQKTTVSIVLISDIHYCDKKDIKHLNNILDRIKKINPKFICIPGDLVDESDIRDEAYLLIWLRKLSQVSSVILSIGNHEFYFERKRKNVFNTSLFNKIQKIDNLFLLDNQSIIIDNINFVGLTLPLDYYDDETTKDITPFISNIKPNKKCYNILLCHSPFNIVKEKVIKKLGFDLILCGHTHGGATPAFLRPLFKNSGLISPNYSLFCKNVYGKIKIDNTNIIITSGIRVISNLNPFKIFKSFFASEIVIIKIK